MEVEDILQPAVDGVKQMASLMDRKINGLPPVGGTWEDEEPTIWQFTYTSNVGSNIPLDDSTTALGLFGSFFTQPVGNCLSKRPIDMQNRIQVPRNILDPGMISQFVKCMNLLGSSS